MYLASLFYNITCGADVQPLDLLQQPQESRVQPRFINNVVNNHPNIYNKVVCPK